MSQLQRLNSSAAGTTSLVVNLTTVDDTVTTMYSRTTGLDESLYVNIFLLAHQDDSAEGIAGRMLASSLRNALGTSLLLNVSDFAEDDDDADPTAIIDVSGNDLRLRVTGDPDETYVWRAFITFGIL